MDDIHRDGAPDLSAALNTLLSDPELISRISGIVNGNGADPQSNQAVESHNDDTAQASAIPPPGNAQLSGLGGLLSNPDIMSKLPQVMATIAPMLNGDVKSTAHHQPTPHHEDRRSALLCALKPYLSPRRCQAIDYIIKLEKIGSLLQTIK